MVKDLGAAWNIKWSSQEDDTKNVGYFNIGPTMLKIILKLPAAIVNTLMHNAPKWSGTLCIKGSSLIMHFSG